MDQIILSVFADLEIDDVERDLWEPLLPQFARAASGDGEQVFLDALESVAWGVGLSRAIPVGTLLQAFCDGSEALRAGLLTSAAADASAACRRIVGFEQSALTRIAVGYAAGLEDTITRLQREAEEASPFDPSTGAMKPNEIGELLALEVNRCQRMDLSLGLVGLALEDGGGEGPSGEAGSGSPLRGEIGRLLRENLRRYDGVGLTGGGDFLLILPDASRRGLAGAAERLRRAIDGSVGGSPQLLFALAHFDFVDVSPTAMLTTLDEGLHRARVVNEPLVWS